MSFEIFFIVATWTDEPHLRNCNLEWTGGTRDETLSDGPNWLTLTYSRCSCGQI